MSELTRKLDQASGPRCYFACANNVSAGGMAGREILGLGISRLVKKDPAPLAEALRPPDDGRWIFAVRFAPEQKPSDEWRDFGAALFWRPAEWIENDGTRSNAAAAKTPFAFAGGAASPYEDNRWPTAFDAAKARLADSGGERSLQKVVLARPYDFTGGRKALTSQFDAQSEHAHRFAFVLGEQNAFFGATPELLARTEGDTFFTEAVAGTVATGSEDLALLDDEKQRHEHRLVTNAIAQRLDAYPTEVRGPAVRRHGDVAHMVTTFAATGVPHPWAEVARLMPTPAVCGAPRDVAREFITAHEGFDRGMYAGAVGFYDGHNVFIAVALRCALVHKAGVRVYAGGGLVDKSERELERAELLYKSALWRRWCS